MSEEIKAAPIRNGTVIDHITSSQALNVLKILGVNENTIDSTVIVVMHVYSKKLESGWKDVVKIEDRELDQNTVDKIALIAPQATIVIIRDYYVANKFKVDIGNHVVGLARCSNPDCITNKGEPIEPEFDVISKNPTVLRCMYCERKLTNISDNLL